MQSYLEFDQQKTNERINALNSYFNAQVMVGNRFLCSSYQDCLRSHQGKFCEGQLHHVGNHYDAYPNGRPFRIMIVGQEYGHGPAFVTLDARKQMILNQSGLQKTFNQRNPHMRGTTSALRLLYGLPLSADHASEFLQSNSERCHLFDAFALANYLLCSAHQDDEGSRGKATVTMLKACQRHFRKAVEILEPTIMVIQSKGFWRWVKGSFDRVRELSNELYLANFGGNQTVIAVFAHPSTPDNLHNWGRSPATAYLLDTVAPTLNKIREISLDDNKRRSLALE